MLNRATTDAYNDTRFDKAADKRNNFVTKSILTVPVIDAEGKGVAVIQVPLACLASHRLARSVI